MPNRDRYHEGRKCLTDSRKHILFVVLKSKPNLWFIDKFTSPLGGISSNSPNQCFHIPFLQSESRKPMCPNADVLVQPPTNFPLIKFN